MQGGRDTRLRTTRDVRSQRQFPLQIMIHPNTIYGFIIGFVVCLTILTLTGCTPISEDEYIADEQYELCIEHMMEYHEEYPTFWTGSGFITINALEESTRFCDWYYDI